MKHNFFNSKLFLNTFSRLKLPGILFTIICIFVSVIRPINYYLENIKYNFETGLMYNPDDISYITPSLFVFVFVGAITLSLIAFSFLNKRKSSDFYHSLPSTRICTYISIALAVLSWLYITIISTVLIITTVYNSLGITVNSIYPLYLILSFMSSATLIAAACFIAMSITGTIFSNIAVTALILFLPRFVTFTFSDAVKMTAINTTITELGFISNHNYNLPFAFIFQLYNQSSTEYTFDTLLTFTGGIVYTFILAILFLVAGCFLFKIRKSEIAEKSSPNKLLQHVYRMSITSPFLIIIVFFFAYSNSSFGQTFSSNILEIILLFGISIIVYYTYELVTTKKVKNLLLATPLYLVIIGLTVIIGFTAKYVGNKILYYAPDISEIKSVSVIEKNTYDQQFYYTDIKNKNFRFENAEIIEIAASSLQNNLIEIKQNKTFDINKNTYNITFYLKNGKSVKRKVSYTYSDIKKFNKAVVLNKQYMTNLREFPSDSEISEVYCSYIFKDESKKVWESFKEEVKNLSDEDFYKIMNASPNSYIEPNSYLKNQLIIGDKKIYFIDTIGVNGSKSIYNYYSFYRITNLTPKTAALYMSLCNKSGIDNLKSDFKNIENYKYKPDEDDSGFTFYLNLFSFNYKNKYINNYVIDYDPYNESFENLSISEIKEICNIISKSGLKPAEIGKPFLSIQMYDDGGSTAYIKLSEKNMQKITAISKS